MPTIRTRAAKESALSQSELDNNFKRTVTQKTDSYQILISDNRSVIEANKATATTMTLPPVATADNAETGDYEVTVTNIGAGISTVDGSGAELIDGSANLALQQWASATFILDSAQTGWKSVARSNVLAHTGALTVTGAFTSVGIDDNADSTALTLAATTLNATFAGDVTLSNSSPELTITDSNATDVTTYNGGIQFVEGTTSQRVGQLQFVSGASDLLAMDSDGTISLRTNGSIAALTLDASQNATFAGDVSVPTKTPASAGATGTTGTITWDANYIYVCTATNTWKRTAISTW